MLKFFLYYLVVSFFGHQRGPTINDRRICYIVKGLINYTNLQAQNMFEVMYWVIFSKVESNFSLTTPPNLHQ